DLRGDAVEWHRRYRYAPLRSDAAGRRRPVFPGPAGSSPRRPCRRSSRLGGRTRLGFTAERATRQRSGRRHLLPVPRHGAHPRRHGHLSVGTLLGPPAALGLISSAWHFGTEQTAKCCSTFPKGYIKGLQFRALVTDHCASFTALFRITL